MVASVGPIDSYARIVVFLYRLLSLNNVKIACSRIRLAAYMSEQLLVFSRRELFFLFVLGLLGGFVPFCDLTRGKKIEERKKRIHFVDDFHYHSDYRPPINVYSN